MKQAQGIIERLRSVNDHYQHLELALDKEDMPRLRPGQSLLVRLEDSWQPYLREHWWPVGFNEKRIIIERPADRHYTPGQVADVLGPVGQGFKFRRTLRNVLLLAYDTPPTPLLMAIPWLLGNKVGVSLVLLGSATNYSGRHIPPEVEIIHGDEDANWPDQVMTVGFADQVFAVVAQDDEIARFRHVFERFRERRPIIPQNYLFGVFQPSLICGAGGCNACTLRMRNQAMQLVCSAGPAFDLTQVHAIP